jgi:hypothetical protein
MAISSGATRDFICAACRKPRKPIVLLGNATEMTSHDPAVGRDGGHTIGKHIIWISGPDWSPVNIDCARSGSEPCVAILYDTKRYLKFINRRWNVTEIKACK